MTGHALFAQYAYPPNELGYCGPTDNAVRSATDPTRLASHAEEFDGAWPYLAAIADAVGRADPLDEDVVRSYWVGGPSLDKVDPDQLLARLRTAFKGQVTGLLDELATSTGVLAHHSFHVFVVYPWVRFPASRPDDRGARDAGLPHPVGNRRIGSRRTGHGRVTSAAVRPGRLTLGDTRTEQVRWSKQGVSLAPAPDPGATVSAHWDWVCGTLTDDEAAALAAATQATLDVSQCQPRAAKKQRAMSACAKSR